MGQGTDRRWRRVRRATTRLVMTSVTSAARASAGVPPARNARRGTTTGSGRARRTAANPVRPVGRRYPVRSATRAVTVCGPADRLPPLSGRPSHSRQASTGNPRLANPSRRQRRPRRPARHPARPNHCSRRSPGPGPSPRPGARWSRRLRRGVLRNLPHGTRLRRCLRRRAPRSGGSLRSLCLPRGAIRNRRPHLATGPHRHPPRQHSPPRRRSLDHRRIPRLQTWHHSCHRPLRRTPNRPHSRLPSSHRPRSCSSRRPRARLRLNHRLPPSGLSHLRSLSRRPSQPRPQHLHHRSPQPPGPCWFLPTAPTTTG